MVILYRGDPRFGCGRDPSAFLPVEVLSTEVAVLSAPVGADDAGRIEIVLALGYRLTLRGILNVEVVLPLARGMATTLSGVYWYWYPQLSEFTFRSVSRP